MKKLFPIAAALIAVGVAGTAYAADLPNTKEPPVYAPPPPPLFSWTGVYGGGQIGYQWGESQDPYEYERSDPSVVFDLSSHDDEGIVGGAHIGYNWQVSQFVFGLEGDVNGSSYQGSSPSFAGAVVESTQIGIEGSIRGRVGIAWDRVLIYGTGGVAFASITNSFNDFAISSQESLSTGRAGWTAGGGIEYALDNNWSVRGEYRYTDYGNVSYSIDPICDCGFSVSKHITYNMVTAGFSYKFDLFAPSAPVVTKY